MKETIKLLKGYVNDKEDKIYLIGEYVRGKLKDSSKEPDRIDIVLQGEEVNLINYLEAYGFKFHKLNNKQRGYKETEEMYIWNSSGKDIDEYLQEIDFTVNAIALDIKNNKIIDPFKGRWDLKCKLVNEVMQSSISKEPLRILSAIKLAVENGMHLTGFTEDHIRLYKEKLLECNKEELYQELLTIFSKDKDGNAIECLDRYGVLENLFPYIKESKTMGRCKYHVVNAYTHMEITYRTFKDLVSGRLFLNGIKEILINRPIQNFWLYDFIAIAAFLHDIGKFSSHKKEDGKVSFKAHNEIGAKITEEALSKLQFPKEAIEIVTTVVAGHMQPLEIFKKGGLADKKLIKDFFDKYGEVTPMILAVSFCDVYATLSLKDDDNEAEAYRTFMEGFIEGYKSYI